MREYRSKLYEGRSTSALPVMTQAWNCRGMQQLPPLCGSSCRSVFPMSYFDQLFCKPRYVEESLVGRMVNMFSGKSRVVRRATQWRKSGRSSMHTFRTVSSAAKQRLSDSHIVPTSFNSSGFTPWFTCANKSRQLSMNWKKTFKDMVHMIPEQMIQDPVGNIHKKCNARKQAEGNHFESFF